MNQTGGSDIKVFIVDDHSIVCQGISALIETIDGFSVIASSQKFCLTSIIEKSPDIVLMDIKLLFGNGIDATAEIKAKNPGIKVLILSGYYNQSLLASAIKAGANGYLTKAAEKQTLQKAMTRIMASDTFFVDENLKEAYSNIMENSDSSPSEYSLSPREKNIFILIADEKSTRDIAGILGISEKTVRNHKSNIRRKLNLDSDAALIKHAYSMALI